MDKKPVIAITIGDPAGIGPEILVKALSLREIYKNSVPVVIGDYGTILDALAAAGSVQRINRLAENVQPTGKHGVIDLIDLMNVDPALTAPGRGTAQSGRAAWQYVEKAAGMAQKGLVHAVVGGPVSREIVTARELGGALTVGVMGEFRVAYPATAIPLKDVPGTLTVERVRSFIRMAHQAGIRLGVVNPRLAVLGLNAYPQNHPGPEERFAIGPAITQAVEEGIAARGPLSVEAAMEGLWRGDFDIAVAMYHEQGITPMALLDTGRPGYAGRWHPSPGAKLVWGLSFPYTTVAHGPQFEMAGHNKAQAGSLVEAIRLAATVADVGGTTRDEWVEAVEKRALP